MLGIVGLFPTTPSCVRADSDESRQQPASSGGAEIGVTDGTGGADAQSGGDTSIGGGGVGGSLSSVTLEQYCEENDCSLPGEADYCYSFGLYWVTARGCGYLRVAHESGATPGNPSEVNVWDESSGELVYHFSRPEGSTSDSNAIRIGEEPDCTAYVVICDTGYACPRPPHGECFGGCYNGCLPPGVTSCGDLCVSNMGGQGGVGGAP